MRESSSLDVVYERRLWFERFDVVSNTAVTVQNGAPMAFRLSKIKERITVLLNDTTGFQFHFPDRGLTLAPDTFVEKAARTNQALSQRLWIVGIFRDDIVLAYWSWIG